MKVSKRFALAAASLSLAGTLFSAGMASADPTAPPANPYDRPLHGEGSDTTEEVMNGLAEAVTDGSGNKLIASWNAKGTTGFTTRNPAVNANCTYTGNPTPDSAYVQGARANGSGNGARALRDAFTAGQPTFGCLDFARSSSSPSVGNLGAVQVKAIHLATDSLTFAVSKSTAIPRQLTKAQLQAAYHCTFGGFATTYKALIPQAGSGTRSSWLAIVGLTEADLTPAGSFPCVTDQTDLGTRGGPNPIQEHDLRVLNSTSIAPVSTAQWIGQMSGISPDLRGPSMLGTVKASTGTIPELSYPLALNTSYGNLAGTADDLAMTRTVYNVVPTSTLTGGANPNSNAILAFEDTDPSTSVNTSLICQRSDIIQRYGFAPIATCGTGSVIN